MDYQKMTMNEFKIKINNSKLALLPIGAVEAHGPHLPLGTDNFLAEKITNKIAKKTSGIVLPVIPYGQVWGLENFPGSINITNESLIPFIFDIGAGLYKQGFRILAVINGHLGNETAIKIVARKLIDKYKDFKVLYFSYPGIRKEINEICETKNLHPKYFHACEIETSLMLYMNEEYVQMDKAISDDNNFPIDVDYSPTRWDEFTKNAVLGDATLATKEKGKYIAKALVDRISNVINEVKNNYEWDNKDD